MYYKKFSTLHLHQRNDILRLYKMGVLRYDYCIEKHRTITGLQIVYLNGMKRVLKGIEMSFLHKILELAPNFIFIKYFPISIFLYENNVQIERCPHESHKEEIWSHPDDRNIILV